MSFRRYLELDEPRPAGSAHPELERHRLTARSAEVLTGGWVETEGVADPALDLAALFHAARSSAEAAVASYLCQTDVGPQLAERIEAYRLLREVAGLAYLLRNDILEEVEEGVHKIGELL